MKKRYSNCKYGYGILVTKFSSHGVKKVLKKLNKEQSMNNVSKKSSHFHSIHNTYV